jgi:Uma2 family endonuclease
MAIVQRATFEDLLDTPVDDYHYELVRGEIVRMPPPKDDHGDIEAALVGAIDRYLYSRAIAEGWVETQGRTVRNRLVGCLTSGEAGVRISLPDDPDQVRGIDVGYLSPEQVARLDVAAPRGEYLPESPSLIAEVISPSERAGYVEKVADYFAGGAHLVWLLFPGRRTVRVCRPDGTTAPAGDTLDGEAVLPGFSVSLTNLFA